MYLVIIHRRQEPTTALAQALAGPLQTTAFDARQRLIGSGPAVVATFAEPDPAQELLRQLHRAGFEAFMVDALAVQGEDSWYHVHRFQLGPELLQVEAHDGRRGRVALRDIGLVLPAIRTAGEASSKTVTERKFSLGKTLLAGGVPMTTKVARRETVAGGERERVLYLCAGPRTRLVFAQDSLAYDGLGALMQATSEMNFQTLVAEMRRRCPTAGYDDRLLSRAGQAGLLGPRLRPETSLELAVEILARGRAE